jgi:anti-anti-sigma factor
MHNGVPFRVNLSQVGFRHSLSRRSSAMAANPVTPIPELHVETETTPTGTTFHFTGRIVSSTSSILRDAVGKVIPEKKDIVLDLSKVSYVDSAGLGTLVGVWVSAKRGECDLKLVSLTDRIKELLRLTNLDKLFATSRFPDTPSF